MHLPCAFIAQRFGGKCLLVFGVACSAVFSLLTPAAVSWGGANALIAIRIIIGSAQGGMWPAVSMMMAAWIPTSERNTVGSMVFSGLSVLCVVLSWSVREQRFIEQKFPLIHSAEISWGILWLGCCWTIIEIGMSCSMYSGQLGLL